MQTLNDHRTLSTFSSGRDDATPFVGFRLSLRGDLSGQIEHRMSLDELDLFMRRLSEEREIVVKFEDARGKSTRRLDN